MNALISASDIKTFYSALHCLSRFSETFWLQCSPRTNGQTQIRLSAINPTNSAFCMFAFDPDFFLSVTNQSDPKIECQITLKPILLILRSRGRSVERLEIDLTDSGSECRFTVTLHCAHSILKSHRLTYSPKRGLLPTADPNPPNFFCIQASTASEWTDHFLSSSRNGEITFLCSPDSCVARSKEEEIVETRGQIRKAIHTEVKIAVEEFKDYCVLEETSLTFSLREFKATVGLAEALGVALEVNFSDGDEPLFVRLRVENAVAAEFVIATTKGDRTSGAAGTGGAEGAQAKAPAPGIAASAGTTSSSLVQREQGRSRSGETSASSARAETSSSSLAPQPQQSTRQASIPNQSTPLPPAPQHEEEEDESQTQPLFFPGASQLSLAPSQEEPPAEVTFVQPTPVAQGGDPGEFLAPNPTQDTSASLPPSQRSRSDSDSEDAETEGTGGPRKRFKPLF